MLRVVLLSVIELGEQIFAVMDNRDVYWQSNNLSPDCQINLLFVMWGGVETTAPWALVSLTVFVTCVDTSLSIHQPSNSLVPIK